MTRIRLFTGAAALLLAIPAAAQDEPEETASVYQALIDRWSPSVVSIRMVVKIEVSARGRGQDQEERVELAGALVSKDGMILCSYDQFSSIESEQFSLKRTPVEIKVVFDREEKEYDAELVATDKKVNLAFLRIKDLESREVLPVDFGAAEGKAGLGKELYQIGRMDKGFDYTPFVRRAVVSARVKKPRKAWMLDGSIVVEGLPVFEESGALVGVLTTLESGLREPEGGMFGFGRGGRPFLLDAKVVAALVEQAARQAAAGAAEPAEVDATGEDGKRGDQGGG